MILIITYIFQQKEKKMEKFACKNLGIDCDFVVTGATKAEVLKHALEHGSTVHADMMKSMTKDQSAQFARKLEASIAAV
jgi:predicted small metal-binding protein